MVHKTKGIVLRVVKYGETSIICTVFTELLGLQSYMVKGVRTSKSRRNKASQLFPSAILDMVVYQQAQRNLHHIKEYSPAVLYQSLHEEVLKNSVALFSVEVISQILVADDPQPELFSFFKQFLSQLDDVHLSDITNFPLFFLIQAGRLSGYHIAGTHSTSTSFADVHEGRFSAEVSRLPPFIEGSEAALMSKLNGAQTIAEIASITMTGSERQKILNYYLTFLQLHIPHFKTLKSLPVLISILY